MNMFLIFTAIFLGAFSFGVWLAPVVRSDYGEFKQYVKSAEDRVKAKTISIINKL